MCVGITLALCLPSVFEQIFHVSMQWQWTWLVITGLQYALQILLQTIVADASSIDPQHTCAVD